MKKIAIVSTQRSDYNLDTYIREAIGKEFELLNYDYGWHFQIFGCELKWVENDIETRLINEKPDLLIINGDRLELWTFILPAVVKDIPIAHIGGGEITSGSIDNQTRWAISRYAHLHFVPNAICKEKLIWSGEESWRIIITGYEGQENVLRTIKLSLEETSEQVGLDLSEPTAICIYYPEYGIPIDDQIETLINSVKLLNMQIVFINPCFEINSEKIEKSFRIYCEQNDNCRQFNNLENQLFVSLMTYAKCMIGNSSCGIIEAPVLGLPFIEIGNRQNGRKAPFGKLDKWPSEIIVQAIKDNIDNPNLLYKKIF